MTEKAKLELVEDSAPGSIFDDLETLRKTATLKVSRRVVQVNMTVGKPKNNVYFQCHPDPAMSLDASVLIDPNKSYLAYARSPSRWSTPGLAVPSRFGRYRLPKKPASPAGSRHARHTS